MTADALLVRGLRGWTSAGGTLDLATNLAICDRIIAEAMRREEYQVAAGYEKLADQLRAEFK